MSPWMVLAGRYAVLCGLTLLVLSGCQRAYYATMEKFGYHKRDILAQRVQDARDSQEEAKEQFQSALEKFSAVLNFHGGALEEQYNQLKAEFERSEVKAKEVRKRIKSVEDVAQALFREWEAELEQYSNTGLRRASAQQLADTRRRYTPLIGAMRRAETKIEPVLSAFRDQVLFLKHNLNARAIASLKQEQITIETDIASLIRAMEASIAEANTFIKTMHQS
jgi:hypothetical protein